MLHKLKRKIERHFVSTDFAYRFSCEKAQRSVVLPLPQKAYWAFQGPPYFFVQPKERFDYFVARDKVMPPRRAGRTQLLNPQFTIKNPK